MLLKTSTLAAVWGRGRDDDTSFISAVAVSRKSRATCFYFNFSALLPFILFLTSLPRGILIPAVDRVEHSSLPIQTTNNYYCYSLLMIFLLIVRTSFPYKFRARVRRGLSMRTTRRRAASLGNKRLMRRVDSIRTRRIPKTAGIRPYRVPGV